MPDLTGKWYRVNISVIIGNYASKPSENSLIYINESVLLNLIRTISAYYDLHIVPVIHFSIA